MNRYCVFLRGINVNGISIKMEALQKVFLDMGYPDAKTVLATGNVCITLPEGDGPEAHKAKIEQGLSSAFSYDAHAMLRSAEEVRTLLESAKTVDAPAGCHIYALLIEERNAVLSLKAAFEATARGPEERFLPLEQDALWIVPKGETLKTEFGAKVLGSKRYKSVLTSRNINTLGKVDKLLRN